MPIASEAIATSANAGLLPSQRSAKRMSAASEESKTHDYKPPMTTRLLTVLRVHDPARRRARTAGAVVVHARSSAQLSARRQPRRVAAGNFFVADGPAFQPRGLTPYTVDDGQGTDRGGV